MACRVNCSTTSSSRSRLYPHDESAVAPQGSSPLGHTPTTYPYRRSLSCHHSQSYSAAAQYSLPSRQLAGLGRRPSPTFSWYRSCLPASARGRLPRHRHLYQRHQWQQGQCCLTRAELRKRRRGQCQPETGQSYGSALVAVLTRWCCGGQLSRYFQHQHSVLGQSDSCISIFAAALVADSTALWTLWHRGRVCQVHVGVEDMCLSLHPQVSLVVFSRVCCIVHRWYGQHRHGGQG